MIWAMIICLCLSAFLASVWLGVQIAHEPSEQPKYCCPNCGGEVEEIQPYTKPRFWEMELDPHNRYYKCKSQFISCGIFNETEVNKNGR
jgi:hypothetical protein